MPDWSPFPLFCFLVALVLARAGGTYALGRGARSLAERRTDLAERATVRRTEQLVERYGPWAVVLCFLTVGVQTAVNAAAGSLRMPLRRYLPALAIGALLWATIYVTIGLAALEAVWGGRWWVLPVVLGALALLGWLVHRWFAGRASVSDQESHHRP